MVWALIQVSLLILIFEPFAHNSANSQLVTNVMAGNLGVATSNAIPQFTTNEAGVTIIAGEYFPIPL
jgi:hypothetical protein